MGLNEIIVVIMAVALVVAAVDRAAGGRLGLGSQLERA